MALRLLTDEQRAAGQQRMREQYPDPLPPVYKNVQAARMIDLLTVIPHRGHLMRAHVGMEDGFEISDIINRWDTQVYGKTGKEAIAAGRAIYADGMKLIRRLVHFHPRWMRWVYRDPFRDLTEGEFVAILRFLSLSRMK